MGVDFIWNFISDPKINFNFISEVRRIKLSFCLIDVRLKSVFTVRLNRLLLLYLFLCVIVDITETFFIAIVIAPPNNIQKGCGLLLYFIAVTFFKNVWNNSSYEVAVIGILEPSPNCPIGNINVFGVASSSPMVLRVSNGFNLQSAVV